MGMIRISKADAQRCGLIAKRSKYGSRRTTCDNIVFASAKEAARYGILKALFHGGVIRNLELQPKFDLHAPGGQKVGRYIADFRYFDVPTQKVIVEDVKGMRTPVYRLKKKIVESEYGIVINEV